MKLIHHAIRMAAFNTAQSLARAIATGTGYARDDDEAHALIRTALGGAGGHHPRPRPGHAPHPARPATGTRHATQRNFGKSKAAPAGAQ